MKLDKKLNVIQDLIRQTELSCDREPGSVLLLAVSKQQPAGKIREAFQYGLHNFAENYFQEAEKKIHQLKLPICWHFIGPIQSNKTKGIATLFQWVHTIDRYKIAERLNQQRPEEFTPLNVCLQINLTDEHSKSGISPNEAAELAFKVNQLPHLKLRGMMSIPPVMTSMEEQEALFKQLADLMRDLNKTLGLKMDTLSMGMSDDLVPAIRSGATIVRIGRAIFGERMG